ncbi:MAG: hypothetical protein JNG90_06580, partial [Planctomycetaceae bacterium]|nr:hypothetical protein [Planctomycetaceae bacterium]
MNRANGPRQEQRRRTGGWARALLVVLAWATALMSVAPAPGQQVDEPQFVGIEVGFESRYLLSAWTQVDLLVRGGRVPMTVLAQVRCEDGDGVLAAVVSP